VLEPEGVAALAALEDCEAVIAGDEPEDTGLPEDTGEDTADTEDTEDTAVPDDTDEPMDSDAAVDSDAPVDTDGEPPVDTGTPDISDDGGANGDKAGCGCAAGGAGTGAPLLVLLGLFVGRRRRPGQSSESSSCVTA